MTNNMFSLFCFSAAVFNLSSCHPALFNFLQLSANFSTPIPHLFYYRAIKWTAFLSPSFKRKFDAVSCFAFAEYVNPRLTSILTRVQSYTCNQLPCFLNSWINRHIWECGLGSSTCDSFLKRQVTYVRRADYLLANKWLWSTAARLDGELLVVVETTERTMWQGDSWVECLYWHFGQCNRVIHRWSVCTGILDNATGWFTGGVSELAFWTMQQGDSWVECLNWHFGQCNRVTQNCSVCTGGVDNVTGCLRI
jgi:hypothetical protein